MEEIKRTDSDIVAENIRLREQLARLQEQQAELELSELHLKAIYKNTPLILLLLDEDQKVIKINRVGLQHSGKSESELLGLRGGDVLHCINSFESSKGCGFGENCPDCVLRKTINEAFQQKKDFFKVEATFNIFRNELIVPYTANVSTSYIETANQSYVLISLDDITEQKIAERNLIESKNRFVLAMNATNDGIWDWNLETNEIYYSPNWKKMLGYKENELEDKFSIWERLTHPDDVEATWNILREHLAGKRDRFENEIRMLHKDGHWVDVLARANAVCDKTGKPVRVVGTHVDISDRKQGELKLADSEYRLKQMFDNTPNGIAIYRAINDVTDFEFVDINKQGEIITNATREKLIGKNLLDEFPNMINSPLLKALSDVYHTGKDVNIPPFYYKDNRRQGWRQNYIYRLPSKEVVAIFSDITEQKMAEDALIMAKQAAEINEEKYRALYENAPLAYQSLNADGYILDVNPTWCSTLGYEREEVLGKWFGSFLNPESLEMFKVRFPMFKAAGCVHDVQFKMIKKDGTVFYVSFEGCIGYTPDGQVRQTYCTFKDITEEMQAKKELVTAKEKAEESNRLKTAFLCNMSHEIRTPMNGILGFSQMLQRDNLPAEKKALYSKIISDNGSQLLNIIDDIIDISKIETEQITIYEQEVNLHEICQEIQNMHSIKAKEKNIELLGNLPSCLVSSKIILDKQKLIQILNNLVGNAIKFTDTGSINMGCDINGQYLQFFVKDTGKGIKPELQHKIFERFCQIDDDLTRQYGGNGLGLPICKGFVERLGGKIWLESEENKGSTFFFTIPYKPVMN